MLIFLILIAYIIGIIWGLYIKSIALLLFILIIFLIFKRIKNVNRYLSKIFTKKTILVIVIIFLIGYCYILFLENSFQNKYKDINEATIEAIVVSNVKNKEYSQIYKIKVESVNGNKSYKGTYLQLHIKNCNTQIKYGDKIKFSGEIAKASEQRNYGGFNYRQYLKTKRIYGIVELNKIENIQKEKYNKFLILINSLNNKIVVNANKILKENEANLLTGILIGNKDNLDRDIQKQFRDSNLSHMLAVSGAHVAYIILGITFILQKSKINRKKSKMVTIILLIVFIILTGGSSSVIRACIMAIYILIGSLIYKKPNIIAGISISMLIILIINPYQILDIGMQLSYAGTIGIIIFNKIAEDKMKLPNIKNEKINKIINYIKQMIIVSISANIMIFPIIAIHYNTISLTFLISNVLAAPILGTIIILGFITVFISFYSINISKIISFILSILIKLLVFIANFTASLPFSKIYIKTPSILFIILYYITAILIFYIYKINKNPKRRFQKRLLNRIKKINLIKSIILIVLIVIFCSLIVRVVPTNFKIYFIDVGQGDSTLIITPENKTILIDGGGSLDKAVYDIGENILLPYLLDRKITIIDYIVISHFDSDHIRTDCLQLCKN